MYIVENTLDDALRRVLGKLLVGGKAIAPSRGAATEFTGAILKIKNPRARLSRSESKGKLFSCLGELLWYLAGSDDLSFITHYLTHYTDESDDSLTVHGAYGPRLFGGSGENQIANVQELLTGKPFSRRAVIQLFRASDVTHPGKGIPCTVSLQFLLRDNRLDMVTFMRSNDAFLGLPHDVFAFTMLQEIIATSLRAKLGTYHHSVGSLHLYNRNRKKAEQFLDEGWQSTVSMPKMPAGDPWPNIETVLKAEADIRLRRDVDIDTMDLPSYWKDLVYLLQIFGYSKSKKTAKIPVLKKLMSSQIYNPYIERRITTSRQ